MNIVPYFLGILATLTFSSLESLLLFLDILTIQWRINGQTLYPFKMPVKMVIVQQLTNVSMRFSTIRFSIAPIGILNINDLAEATWVQPES